MNPTISLQLTQQNSTQMDVEYALYMIARMKTH